MGCCTIPASLLQALRTCFTAPSWEHALVLVMGALLAPGKRTVSSCLRMTGRAEAANFASYHQILNRACWSPRAVARRLLGPVVERLVPDGPIVIGMDDTIEPPMGTPDQRPGHLPGSSALQPWPFRQSQWPALVELHGSDPGAMDEPGKGLAGLDPACLIRAIRPSTRAAPQAADRLGAAGRAATLSLAARAPHHLRRRQQLCRP
ncbi:MULTISPECIES: transposase [unclassified Mesorhizobium]|uniref:transposase n=1 Tax=unclassified Mesorhizobium TaxID=325217 RepID=UPI0033361FE2